MAIKLQPWPDPDDPTTDDRDGLALIRAEYWALAAEQNSDPVVVTASAALANAWAMIAVAHQDPAR